VLNSCLAHWHIHSVLDFREQTREFQSPQTKKGNYAPSRVYVSTLHTDDYLV
jgi:hypothetical protein